MTSQLFIGLSIIDPASNASGSNSFLVTGGKISAVGEESLIREKIQREKIPVDEINLSGKYVLPGFVDAHAHPLMYGQMMDWVDVGPSQADSITEIVAILQKVDSQLPAGVPLRAFGYEHRNLKEGRHPHRNDVDLISTTREIYIMNASGHGGAVNSLVLNRNNVDADTPDPNGGRFERDSDGTPTGVIWDAACDILTGGGGVKLGNHGPNFHLPDSLEILLNQFLQAESDFVKHGTTSIGDAQVSAREFEVFKEAKRQNRSHCRYSLFLTSALLQTAEAMRKDGLLDSATMTASGIKLYADGTLGGWTAYFPEGYAADPERTGQLYHSVEEYEELFLDAAAKGFHIATHAQSPTAISMVIAATRKLRATSFKAIDGNEIVVRIEHCGLPLTSQSQEMAELGIISVSQPLHHHNWGDGVVTAVGSALGGRFNPLGEFMREKVDFAISSDAPVAKPRPFEAIAASVDRRTVHGTQMGDSNLAITVSEALVSHTLGGAKALGREELIGSLSVGKFADFVTVDQNPLELSIEDLRHLSVNSTWIGGIKVA